MIPISGTVRRVARPRGEIPDDEQRELIKARDALARADSRFKAALTAAIDAGGSYSRVAEVARIAKSTVQKYVPPKGSRE